MMIQSNYVSMSMDGCLMACVIVKEKTAFCIKRKMPELQNPCNRILTSQANDEGSINYLFDACSS